MHSPPTVRPTSARPWVADLITTVMESSYYGRCTSTATTGGIVLVKTDTLLLLATYTEPVTGAEAIPYVHKWVANTPAHGQSQAGRLVGVQYGNMSANTQRFAQRIKQMSSVHLF